MRIQPQCDHASIRRARRPIEVDPFVQSIQRLGDELVERLGILRTLRRIDLQACVDDAAHKREAPRVNVLVFCASDTPERARLISYEEWMNAGEQLVSRNSDAPDIGRWLTLDSCGERL